MPKRFWLVAVSIAGMIGVPCFAQFAAPPAKYEPRVTTREAQKPQLLVTPGAAVRSIVLPPPTSAEREQMMEKNVADDAKSGAMKSRRLQIGFARQVPATSASIRLADLAWQDVGGNVKATQLRLTSPGAAALRIALALDNAPSALQLRFAGAGSDATVFGPYSIVALGDQALYWSPVLDGDTGIVEIELPAGADVGAAAMKIPMISHLDVTGAALKQPDPLSRIGRAGSCEMDVACIGESMQEQAATAINAVARMVLVDHGSTYLCSGTLLNDSISSMTPYFFTANHCIDNGNADPAASRGSPAAAAATINTYWFFQANTCGVDTAAGVTFVQVAGGATLVSRSADYDWALVRLNNPPPEGVTFAAWNASAPLEMGTTVAGIHHPLGDLKKFSQGVARGYESESDGSSYIQVQWSQGVTEGGSSGSGLFVLNPATDYYELRGGLWGGLSACSPTNLRSALDIYSRMDVALPYLASSLMPDAFHPKEAVLIVEFYSAALDDYFITADAAEITDLDQGTHRGWVRTGLTFLAYANPDVAPPDAKPVCRFYVLPGVGDSHFYSADADECGAAAARFSGNWVQESGAVFYIQVPDAVTGTCPANTRPVFRFLNTANQLHHRYTIEVDVRDSTIRDGGWRQEGYGSAPRQSVMCSPTI